MQNKILSGTNEHSLSSSLCYSSDGTEQLRNLWKQCLSPSNHTQSNIYGFCLWQIRHKWCIRAEPELIHYYIYGAILRILSGLLRLECQGRVIREASVKGKSWTCSFYDILTVHWYPLYCIKSYCCFYTLIEIQLPGLCHFHTLFSSYFATNNAPWLLLSSSHLHCLYLLVTAVPGDEPAVFSSRQKHAIPQHAQGKDAALVSSLDDMADAISACVTEMGWDGWGGSVGQAERSTAWIGQINRQGDR